jgi:DNA-binding transcriptional LysR family regulator
MNTNWDDLRHLLALHREGSLSKAALALGVRHTTVARRLRALEDALGVRLFERTPGGYVATPEGRELAGTAGRVEDLLLDADVRLSGRDHALSGKLRVTTLDVISCGLPELFASFVRRYPSVELTILTDDRALALHRREADVAVRLTQKPPESLVGRKVAVFEFAPYASASLHAAVGPDAELQDYPWLHWDEQNEASRWLDGWLAEHAPGAKVALRMDGHFTVMRDAVTAGLGVHFLPCVLADPDPRLVRVGEAQGSRMPLWLLTLPELRDTRRVRAFLDHCAQTFNADGSLSLPPPPP